MIKIVKINELQLGSHQDLSSHTTAIDETMARLNQVIRKLNNFVDSSNGNGTGGQGPQGPPGEPGPAGQNGSVFPPETISFSVPIVSPGVWSVGEASVKKKAHLFNVSADQSCIVRLYFNELTRDYDVSLSRPPTTNPGTAKILAEVGLSNTNNKTQFFSPVPVIYNADNPFTNTIYWAVQQTMMFSTGVNVSLYLLPLEE